MKRIAIQYRFNGRLSRAIRWENQVRTFCERGLAAGYTDIKVKPVGPHEWKPYVG